MCESKSCELDRFFILAAPDLCPQQVQVFIQVKEFLLRMRFLFQESDKILILLDQ